MNAFKGMLEDIIPKYVDILFSNESEAEAFTGQKAAEAVHTLSELVEVSLVTLGKEGALIGVMVNFILSRLRGASLLIRLAPVITSPPDSCTVNP